MYKFRKSAFFLCNKIIFPEIVKRCQCKMDKFLREDMAPVITCIDDSDDAQIILTELKGLLNNNLLFYECVFVKLIYFRYKYLVKSRLKVE